MTNNPTSLPFDDYPAFYERDNRQKRGFNPVSKAFLEAKFNTLLPPQSVQGKTVLDLGSCYGAAGQWVLFYGATHYTGVEIQANYVQQSRQLLRHWQARAQIVQQDIRRFLQQTADQSVDVVVLAGVLYHFVDTKSIIDEVCRISREQIVVESEYPVGIRAGHLPFDACVTEYVMDQEVNLDHGDQSMLGLSATTSLSALDILFRLNGFTKPEDKLCFTLNEHTAIYDERGLGQGDLQTRFAVRYFRQTEQALSTLEKQLTKQSGQTRSWEHDPIAQTQTRHYQHQAQALRSTAKAGEWKFDAQVASVFDGIARREIPDYLRVIDLCVRFIQKDPRPQPKIIDVGSATGETLRHLHQVGYRNLYGVEASADMIAHSFNQAVLIHSEQFPETAAPFDYVLNNWTLHFIRDPIAYLAAIKRSLSPNGVLILSDKVSSSPRVHELYYDYKRSKGVSEAEIEQKRQQIEGVLVTHTFDWYWQQLKHVGFEHIEVINANTAFVTFVAVNPAA